MLTLVLWPAATLAVTSSTGSTNTTTTVSQNDRIARLKNKADTEIDRRLKTLNNLITRLNGTGGKVQKLSATNKATLIAQITSETTGLAALKTKIDSTTYATVTDLATDVKSIITDYRVYLLIAKKVGIIVAADSELAAADRLSDLATKLQDKINTAKTAGTDVTSMQALHDDMMTKINDAKAKANAVETAVLALQPNDYNENNDVLSGPIANLKAGRQNLLAAKSDAQTIIDDLKAVVSITKSFSSSGSHFSLRYPASWSLITDETAPFSATSSDYATEVSSGEPVTSKGAKVQVFVQSMAHDLNWWAHSTGATNPQTGTVAGQPSVTFDVTEFEQDYTATVVNYKNKTYLINLNYAQADKNTNLASYQSIIKSFKFTN